MVLTTNHHQLLGFEREGHTVTRGLCTPEEIAGFTKVVRAGKSLLLLLMPFVLLQNLFFLRGPAPPTRRDG